MANKKSITPKTMRTKTILTAIVILCFCGFTATAVYLFIKRKKSKKAIEEASNNGVKIDSTGVVTSNYSENDFPIKYSTSKATAVVVDLQKALNKKIAAAENPTFKGSSIITLKEDGYPGPKTMTAYLWYKNDTESDPKNVVITQADFLLLIK